MKLTPIVIDKEYPLWEYEFDLPPTLQMDLDDETNWKTSDTARHRAVIKSKNFDTILRSTTDLQYTFMDQIFDPNGPFKEEIHRRWLSGVDVRASSLLIKDIPALSEPHFHIDHRNVFAASILNLQDNPCSTEFMFDGKIIHKGPTERGKGILFLNTEHSLHGYANNSNSDRFICLLNIMIDVLPEYHF